MAASDAELTALVIATKNAAAFGELVRRHQGLVRAMLQRMCRNHALADDIAQDAFLRAFEKIGSFKGTGTFKSWLCSIAYTEFLKSARKRKAADRLLDGLKAEYQDEAEAPRDMGNVVDLDRALAELKEDERTVVVMCYSCGMSHSDVAEATGMPLGTVKSHANRGRAKMQAWFANAEVMA
ncbi:RNA polymerase sigma factor [Maricaulis sp. D1M11]|uniref:RNA polymerase sigma factor n=1 Tax=Maricaulis sp. D1M11 TaxID=3076117 RepID=UPI0039B4A29F